MAKKHTTLIIIIIIIIIGYQYLNKKNALIISDDFKVKLHSYIKSNPIDSNQIHIFKTEIPYPSYNIYFQKTEFDTIVIIKLSPYISRFIPYIEKQNNRLLNYEIESIGYFFIGENPVVIFDEKNYSKNIINKKKLKKEIPDSLKFTVGKINRHIKSKTEYYKIINRSILKID